MPDYKKRQTGESNLTITPAQKVTEVLAVLVILYIVYIFITNDIASETKTDENYGEPKSIIATEKQKIEIIPSVGPTMVSRIPYGKQYAFALIYNNETFECHCTPSIWCNDKAVKKGKFYLKSATIQTRTRSNLYLVIFNIAKGEPKNFSLRLVTALTTNYCNKILRRHRI